MPHPVPLHAVGWDALRGFVACGGEKGLLKVLRLDPSETTDVRVCGVASKTELAMNQTLERHERTSRARRMEERGSDGGEKGAGSVFCEAEYFV
jgi:hypothetical protein